MADAHHALSRPAPPTSPSSLVSPKSTTGLYSGEPLVLALWEQVDSFLDQVAHFLMCSSPFSPIFLTFSFHVQSSLDANLVLTAAIGKMATHPHPAVRRCLFAPSSPSSLYLPLSRVCFVSASLVTHLKTYFLHVAIRWQSALRRDAKNWEYWVPTRTLLDYCDHA